MMLLKNASGKFLKLPSGAFLTRDAVPGAIVWLDTGYVVGKNSAQYNAWCPNTAHYDATLGKIVFLQSHSVSHMGTALDSTLCTIDPYNIMEYMDVALPDTLSRSLGFIIDEDGSWNIYTADYVYVSKDHGATWTETVVETSPDRLFGVFKIDGICYSGVDATTKNDGTAWSGIPYYVSEDNGINWKLKYFMSYTDEYSVDVIQYPESSFVKHNGKLYACVRCTDKNGLMLVSEDGGDTWTIADTNLPNYNSDVWCGVVDGRLQMAAIDRTNAKLHLGYWDGQYVNEETFDMTDTTCYNDFHTPCLVVGPDFKACFFYIGLNYSQSYNACNACVVGYAEGVQSVTPSYGWANEWVNNAYDYTHIVMPEDVDTENSLSVFDAETGGFTSAGWAALSGDKFKNSKFDNVRNGYVVSMQPNVANNLGLLIYTSRIYNNTNDTSFAPFVYNGEEYVGLAAYSQRGKPGFKFVGRPSLQKIAAFDGDYSGYAEINKDLFLETGNAYAARFFYTLEAIEAKQHVNI